MNNGQFETLYDGRPGGRTKLWYMAWLLEQQTNSANPIPAGEIMGCGRVGIASRFTRVVYCEVMQQVEDDDAFCRLIYRFTVNKMILKYQSGRKHELTNDMMKRAKGRIVRYSKSAR